MRYTSFRIQNFKGIRDTTVSLESHLGVGVFALVGLNESGKTTILEAIHSFSPDWETGELVGTQSHASSKYKEWVPRHELSSFTGRISVTATATLSETDTAGILRFAKEEHNLVIDAASFSKRISVEKWVEFSNGDFVKAGNSIDGDFSVKSGKQRDWRVPTATQRERVREAVYNSMPDIAYFPTFIFNFPEKIYLTDRGGSTDRFYRRTFQDILDYDGKGYTIDKDIVRRVRADALSIPWTTFLPKWAVHDDKEKIDHVIARASAAVTRLVFGRWNKIFHEDAKDKKVLISYGVDEGEVRQDDGTKLKTQKHDVFVKFEIEVGTRKFRVNSRSQGFRWFFLFMLFTQFRAARSGDRPVLFLFDEPASNLHAAAQQKLVESFPEIARDENMLIYSTHSHYMVEPKWLEQTFIVTNRADDPASSMIGSVSLDDESLDIQAHSYRTFIDEHPNQTSYYQPILDRLEVVPSRFDLMRPTIVVEGKSDFYILRYAERLLGKTELPLVPALGAGTMSALIALMAGWGIESIFLLDGDPKGLAERTRYTEELFVPVERMLTLTDLNASIRKIEDILDDTAKKRISDALGLSALPNKKQILRFFQQSLATGQVVSLGASFSRKLGPLLHALSDRLPSGRAVNKGK